MRCPGQSCVRRPHVAGAASLASSASSAAIAGLLGSSVLSNLVNNLPAVLVFISGAQAGGVQLGLREPFLFGALAGADLKAELDTGWRSLDDALAGHRPSPRRRGLYVGLPTTGRWSLR